MNGQSTLCIGNSRIEIPSIFYSGFVTHPIVDHSMVTNCTASPVVCSIVDMPMTLDSCLLMMQLLSFVEYLFMQGVELVSECGKFLLLPATSKCLDQLDCNGINEIKRMPGENRKECITQIVP
jgi:hypothetical protein